MTPKSFLSFLTAYSETYVKKKDELAELASSINTGLEKLAQATEDVRHTACLPNPGLTYIASLARRSSCVRALSCVDRWT